MSTATSLEHSPAVGPLLALLNDENVEFVVIGPLAAYARGASLDMLATTELALDVVPVHDTRNLTALSCALTRAGNPRLQLGETGRTTPLRLAAPLFQYLDVVRLSTDIADVTIGFHPIGAPTDAHALLDDASAAEIDGVTVLVPSIDALLRGLAGGWTQPHPQLIAGLRRTQRVRPLQAATEPPPADTIADPDHDDIGQFLIEITESLDRPLTTRELLFAAATWRHLSYKQVRTAAEQLTAQGDLLRDKIGTAYRYRRNTRSDARIADEIAALLETTPNPEATARQALAILQDAQRTTTPSEQRPADTSPEPHSA